MMFHDWFWNLIWSIYAAFYDFFLSLWGILWYLPNLFIQLWYTIMTAIFELFDNICYSFVDVFDGLAQSILDAFDRPTWYPSWIELPIALPMMLTY